MCIADETMFKKESKLVLLSFFYHITIMIDYHLHTRLCKHAGGSVEEYVEAAIERGISEIAFTDHIPLPAQFDQAHRMEPEQLDTYVNWVRQAGDKYQDITIRLGIEADYYRGFERYTEDLLKRYDFDVVIMSVHFLRHWPQGNWIFNYDFAGKSIDAVYTDYIDTLIEGIHTGLFDILGHTDLIKKAGDSLIDKVPEATSRLLESISQSAMTIEINTSGYRKAAGESFPGLDWLPLLKQHNIPITVGSDAHSAEQVGLHFPLVYKEIRQQGFETLSTYEKRRRKAVRLN